MAICVSPEWWVLFCCCCFPFHPFEAFIVLCLWPLLLLLAVCPHFCRNKKKTLTATRSGRTFRSTRDDIVLIRNFITFMVTLDCHHPSFTGLCKKNEKWNPILNWPQIIGGYPAAVDGGDCCYTVGQIANQGLDHTICCCNDLRIYY